MVLADGLIIFILKDSGALQNRSYINPPDNISELKEQIEQFINFYDYQRPDQSLSYKTPLQIYYGDNNRRKIIDF